MHHQHLRERTMVSSQRLQRGKTHQIGCRDFCPRSPWKCLDDRQGLIYQGHITVDKKYQWSSSELALPYIPNLVRESDRVVVVKKSCETLSDFYRHRQGYIGFTPCYNTPDIKKCPRSRWSCQLSLRVHDSKGITHAGCIDCSSGAMNWRRNMTVILMEYNEKERTCNLAN